jgi:hypothetical protein
MVKTYFFDISALAKRSECRGAATAYSGTKRIDVLLREQSEPRKTMQVPVYEYAS